MRKIICFLCMVMSLTAMLSITVFGNIERVQPAEPKVEHSSMIALQKPSEKAVPYILEELNMVVEVPAKCSTLVRHMDKNDPALRNINLSARDVTSSLKNMGMYLDVVDEKNNIYMSLFSHMDAESADIFNLDEISENAIEEYRDCLIAQKNAEGWLVSSYEDGIYDNGRHKFIVLYSEEDEYGFSEMYYCTVFNGSFFEFILTEDSKRLTEGGRAALKNLADSMRFTKAIAKDEVMELVKEPKYRKFLREEVTPTHVGFAAIAVVMVFALMVSINRRRMENKK